jgi:hypothetical protein
LKSKPRIIWIQIRGLKSIIFRLKSLNSIEDLNSKEDLEVISDIGNGLGFRRRNMQAMHYSRFI